MKNIKFKKYQHLERFGNTEVNGIENGNCYIFDKIDGTNSSVWYDEEDGCIKVGSRKRELTLDKDNAGFYAYILEQENIKAFFNDNNNKNKILYGEFLVKHTIKDYRDDVWNKFYVFDVIEVEDTSIKYLHYEEYKELLESYNIEYIPCNKIIENGNIESFTKELENVTYLMKNGCIGEGIVIKNYDFINRYGRIVWAKIVRNEFKEKHKKNIGTLEVKIDTSIEKEIVNIFCTEEFIRKEFSKIEEWNSKKIPELFGRVYYEFIKEETYNFVKKFKNPKIDFKILNQRIINKIKEVLRYIF